ncbi:SRPBCC family protein [Daejeonella sp. JGW-45]|uniref:SRPBCC family protein n=1 Tax=Daejeonella sp. JGW-45 TaxID=3034148 RepID=UPI0023ED4595|nr:SRPBCC family protein [Daejeonella sp. JGW-45]
MILEEITGKLKEKVDFSSIQSQHPNVDLAERVLSVLGGVFLTYQGLKQIRKHPFLALQEAAAGGLMLYRAATGFCPVYAVLDKDGTDPGAINITESFIVDRPRTEVYAFWRKLENLPRFMKHLASVDEHDRTRSHWRANLPGEILKLNWNAEITREDENNYIGWQSVEGSMVENAGKVTFHDALNGSGTELTVDISYFPPAGSLGQGIARLLNGLFEKMVRSDVTNFKHYIEGEEYKTYDHKPGILEKVEDVVNTFK